MTHSQRIVLVLYCLLVVYCCVWVPWHVQLHISQELNRPTSIRMGYGWVWAGPSQSVPWDDQHSTPDLPSIGIRLVAATALAGAAFVLAGKWKSHG
jgi:hypothetical protein